MPTGAEYWAAYKETGNFREVARSFGVDESTVRKSAKRYAAQHGEDPAITNGMSAAGLETMPAGVWVKTHEKDALGRTYSFYVRPQSEEEESARETVEATMRNIPAVRLETSKEKPKGNIKGFIPINDLHAGAYAWADETGYSDWDLSRALKRLTTWSQRLITRMPVCQEVILFYNGDTLHANGKIPMTGTHGTDHILDTDTRHFKVVDMTAASMCVVADLAAQRHKRVRIVVKRGNHDEDSYLALLMAMKYRYRDQDNVLVETDPSPYWCHRWGKNLLFGHHGDRVKPEHLAMKLAADFPQEWGDSEHRVVWTAHRHQRELRQFPGVTWEQASCWTDPDAYGAYYGQNAQAVAVIYDREKGEIERHTVRP